MNLGQLLGKYSRLLREMQEVQDDLQGRSHADRLSAEIARLERLIAAAREPDEQTGDTLPEIEFLYP